ncbi:hypothetical protein H7849_12665 [Alloacidobacterium dinghuense]|uniref:Uncharacterized protein n=1 Tax=Alloacidobacterium dinghuense TaxID=2763107 RepID=A0A7G8BQ47_9BACT|nr:hypothetical protein [Alloacidobacterium dinghuense]QNI34667.1 hypothetical protein H7849_12665 [Alloacidobacterium dinghuense]
MNDEKYRKLTSWLIAAWFVFTLLASALHLFQAPPTAPPIAFGLAVLTPILIFVAWFRVSPAFRTFAMNLSPGILTLVQSWRVAGYAFLVLYTFGILPGAFALPAGLGDIAIGLTAPFVAMRLASRSHRTAFIAWQVLGMVDLVTAIVTGTASRFISPGEVTTAPMTALPLSLIPTFAVPLLFILHIVCMAQAREWQPVPQMSGREPLPGSVA